MGLDRDDSAMALVMAIRGAAIGDLRQAAEIASQFVQTSAPSGAMSELAEVLRRTSNVSRPSTTAPEHGGPSSTSLAGSGSRKDRTTRGDLRAWALTRIETALGATLARVGRGETYRAPNGRLVHLRTNQRYDRGHNRFSYWFGIDDELWDAQSIFVLACDTDGLLIVPAQELAGVRDRIARGGQDRRQRQPNIWLNDSTFELRAGGPPHLPLNQWLDRFELLRR